MNTVSSANWQILALVLSVFSLAASIYLLWAIRTLNKLRTIFFAGKKGLDLEEMLAIQDAQLKDLEAREGITEEGLNNLRNHFNFAIQKVGVVRFNPFNDSGGDFSFCLALLDAADSGVVLTSMHGRQQHRIYTKQIVKGQSEMTLTQEEQVAIINANTKFENQTPSAKGPSPNKKRQKQSLRR